MRCLWKDLVLLFAIAVELLPGLLSRPQRSAQCLSYFGSLHYTPTMTCSRASHRYGNKVEAYALHDNMTNNSREAVHRQMLADGR